MNKQVATNDIIEYCEKHSNKNSQSVSEIEQYTWDNEKIPQMLSGQIVGNFLQSIIQIANIKKVVEVGMFTGYSALKMAEHLPKNGEIHTCEIMEKHIKTARSFFSKSPHGNKIFIHPGPAISSLEQMKIKSFDMAFIDGDKTNYLKYYQICLSLVRSKGIIILDNMLWSGSVLDPVDNESLSLRKTGDFIQTDKRVFNTLLPIRDGLMFCIKLWNIKIY